MKKSHAVLLFVLSVLVLSVAAFGEPAKNATSSAESRYIDPATGMEFVLVKGGCFDMGDGFGDGYSDELPVHRACVNDFFIARTVVTQDQWKAIMGTNPSSFPGCGGNCPVEKVSWNDSQRFIYELNKRSNRKFRIPTEAEWEFAARSGGKKEKWAGTSSEQELKDYAWYAANAGKQTHPVAAKKPNGLGLYDMTGNVWQWVADWYDGSYYKASPQDNPQGPPSDIHRVLRGGSWSSGPKDIRTSDRYNHGPDRRDNDMGFRLVLMPQL